MRHHLWLEKLPLEPRPPDDHSVASSDHVEVAAEDPISGYANRRRPPPSGQYELLGRIEWEPDLVGIADADAFEGISRTRRTRGDERGIRCDQTTLALVLDRPLKFTERRDELFNTPQHQGHGELGRQDVRLAECDRCEVECRLHL